ncbi:MAG: ribbon-helix-helix protein, CopG family [Chloroflexi bacterium]|nr:ribbon-helix-helix protein, CopG family [Chloroflexota bacterium]
MQIQVQENLVQKLEELAQQQHRPIGELVADAIQQYITHLDEETQFRLDVRAAMKEHEWLLNELSKQ